MSSKANASGDSRATWLSVMFKMIQLDEMSGGNVNV